MEWMFRSGVEAIPLTVPSKPVSYRMLLFLLSIVKTVAELPELSSYLFWIPHSSLPI